MADGLDVGPVVVDVTVILNPDDPLVTEADIIAMIDAWDRHEQVVEMTILDTDGLPHDAIDVGQPDADPDAVYPVVLDDLGLTWTGMASP